MAHAGFFWRAILLFYDDSGVEVPEVEVEFGETEACLSSDVVEGLFNLKVVVGCEAAERGDDLVVVEDAEDVGVDDRVVVVADVSEKVAGFFEAEAGDGVDEPAAAVVMGEVAESFSEAVFVLPGGDDVGGAGWKAVVVGV